MTPYSKICMYKNTVVLTLLFSWYFQWVFISVNIPMEGRSDKMRSVYLNGFNEVH